MKHSVINVEARRSLLRGLDRVEMEHGVEPLAQVDAFPHLHLNLLLAQRLDEHEDNGCIECSSCQPAWKKSLAHDGSEVAFLDVEHVGCSVTCACEVG